MFPASNQYNIPFIFKFDRPVGRQKILNSLESVFSEWFPEIGSHIQEENGNIRLAVPEELKLNIETISCFDDSEAEQKIQNFVSMPFDLNAGPMHRFLILAGSGCSYLVLVFHHIIFDEGCVPQMISSLSEAYNGSRQRWDESFFPSLRGWLMAEKDIGGVNDLNFRVSMT